MKRKRGRRTVVWWLGPLQFHRLVSHTILFGCDDLCVGQRGKLLQRQGGPELSCYFYMHPFRYYGLQNQRERGKQTYLFRGWKAAEVTGASNRMVVTRLGGSVSEAKSQMMTFQSFEEVRTYLELRLQLHCKETEMKNKQIIRTHD